jgi:nitrogen fixation/metabolism regulation signal transduction histidine kinase
MNEKLNKDRMSEIIEAVKKVARGDYSVQMKLSNKNDDIDSLAMGLNMMIDDIKQAQEALKENEERLKSTLSSMDDLVFVLDKNGVFIDYYQPLTRSDLYVPSGFFLGKSFKNVQLPPDVVKSFENGIDAVTATGKVQQVDYSLEIKGEKKWYSAKVSMRKDSSGEFDGVTVVSRDISENKLLEEKLVHQEKLAVLGQLAGGVGHELRNPLGAIKNSAYFLNMVLEEPSPEVKETLEILEKEVTISERIINSLLDYARVRPPLKRKLNINDILQDALSGINVPENIEVKTQVDEFIPYILADPDQLGQVFGNILLNAIQAMPEGGRLIIKSETPGPDSVTISIVDTGVGIPGENMGKIFEPLFTSKAKGIGLGMAVAKTFVEAHGGSIEVQSETGKGSTFTVRLPPGKKEEK